MNFNHLIKLKNFQEILDFEIFHNKNYHKNMI